MNSVIFKAAAFFVFLAMATFAFAQDDIIMKNSDVIKARVEEVGLDAIRYHRADNPDGPIYDLPKRDIYMIVYANGTRDVINPNGGESPAPAEPAADQPIRTAPPEMPTYEQPYCPGDGYLWTPGYWAWGLWGYYWVPGTWVMPPHYGYLWTPGYWGYVNGFYGWHEGYWGEHIGYYGGINYGFGYTGVGYYGGRWEGEHFMYNTAVTRVNVTEVHNTYINNTVVNNTTVNRSSFNGQGGVTTNPTPIERQAMSEKHLAPTTEQTSHFTAARNDKSQYVSENHGHPTVTAFNKPGGQAYSSQGHETKTTMTYHSSQPNNAEHNNQQPGRAEEHDMRSNEHASQPTERNEHANQPAERNDRNMHSSQPVERNEHSVQPAQRNEEHQTQHINNVQPQHSNPQPQRSQPQRSQPQRSNPQPQHNQVPHH